MNDLTQDNVSELATAALEGMAFMIVDLADSAEDVEMNYHASITYSSNEEHSEVFLSASEGFLAELASSMLGVEVEEVSMSEEGIPALTELANIMAGEVARTLGAETNPFDVGIPVVVDSVPDSDDAQDTVGCYLDSMGEMLRVLVVRKQVGAS